MNTQSLRRFAGPVVLLWAFLAGCVPRTLETPAGVRNDAGLEPYEHQALLHAGTYAWRSDSLAADTFRIFHSVRGGYVLHASRRSAVVGDAEVWLEVSADFRPVRGWERLRLGGQACERSFVVSRNAIEVWTRTPLWPTGTRFQFGAPSRFGVQLSSDVALGWALRNAGAGALSLLRFGHCPAEGNHTSGLVQAQIHVGPAGVRTFAGHQFSALEYRMRWASGASERVSVAEGVDVLLERTGSPERALSWYWSAAGR